MKRFTLAFLFVALCAIGSDVVKFDPVSTPITNRVERFLLSVNTPDYMDKSGFLVVTNREAQSASGVAMTNLNLCVVDGQQVRLMTQAELNRIAATNALNQVAADALTKYQAREYATNVIQGTGGQELFLRALAESTWFYINQIRTNSAKPALTKNAFIQNLYENINTFGQ